jgi:RNA polymerase sigma factor (sigma-70 family)
MSMGREESSLYARIAAGEDAAFQTLIEPYQHQLGKFVGRQLAGDTRAVDDVLQETYIAAYRAIAAGARPEHIKPWLYTIARNQACNVRRSRKPTTPVDESAVAAVAPCPVGAVEQGERMEWLMAAISDLPVRQRTALVEHIFEGRSYGEIAQRQETTIGAVKTLMHRARHGLTQSADRRFAALLPLSWIARVLPRRTHALLAGKLGAKAAIVGQTLAAAVLATGALVVVQGVHVPVVRASGGHPTAKTHRHAASGRGSRALARKRARRQGERAIRQCSHTSKVSPHLGMAGLVYARAHPSALLREYTDCPRLLFVAELRAVERDGSHRMRHDKRTHRIAHRTGPSKRA